MSRIIIFLVSLSVILCDCSSVWAIRQMFNPALDRSELILTAIEVDEKSYFDAIKDGSWISAEYQKFGDANGLGISSTSYDGKVVSRFGSFYLSLSDISTDDETNDGITWVTNSYFGRGYTNSYYRNTYEFKMSDYKQKGIEVGYEKKISDSLSINIFYKKSDANFLFKKYELTQLVTMNNDVEEIYGDSSNYNLVENQETDLSIGNIGGGVKYFYKAFTLTADYLYNYVDVVADRTPIGYDENFSDYHHYHFDLPVSQFGVTLDWRIIDSVVIYGQYQSIKIPSLEDDSFNDLGTYVIVSAEEKNQFNFGLSYEPFDWLTLTAELIDSDLRTTAECKLINKAFLSLSYEEKSFKELGRFMGDVSSVSAKFSLKW